MIGKEEFFLQVFQRRIIEVELPFERAVGGALTAPEQVNNLVEHGIKIHSPSPQPAREDTSWMMAHHTRTLWKSPRGGTEGAVNPGIALSPPRDRRACQVVTHGQDENVPH